LCFPAKRTRRKPAGYTKMDMLRARGQMERSKLQLEVPVAVLRLGDWTALQLLQGL